MAKIRRLTARTFRKLARVVEGIDSGSPINISDEYVDWLCYANAGMLERGNLYSFDYAIRNLPSEAPIVEVGSFCGLSTNLLTYYKQKHGKSNPLITCDKWQFEGTQNGSTLSAIWHSEYREFVKDTFLRNVRMFSREDLPYTIETLSDEFFTAWAGSEKRLDVFDREVQLGGPISFCYLEGNHSYEYVKRDFKNCDEHLDRGGFVLFDDSQDGAAWEVCKIVAEIKESKEYELVAKNPNYLFRKI